MRYILTALGLSAVALLIATRPVESEPRFSRAEWIEAHEVENRFDGGALPKRASAVVNQRGEPKASADVAEPAPAAGGGVVNVQVNVDLFPDDESAAQPETQAEPFLAADPLNENRLLAGYQEGRFQGGGARALSYALSTNGGRRWSSGFIPGLTEITGGPWQRASDPWVAFGPDHRAYYVSLAFDETSPRNAVVVSSSSSGGASWGEPVTVHMPTGTDFDDKEAIVVDNVADSPFRGRVYVAWDMARENGTQPLFLSSSDDGGASFSPVVTVKQGVNLGAVPLVGPGGVVYLVWADFAFFDHVELVTSRSDDGGATWSAPVRIDDSYSFGVREMRTGGNIPAAAVDPKNGTLYVVWQDSRYTGIVEQVLISRSTDGGTTWSSPEVVSDGPGNAASFTPAVAVDGAGRVGVAYYSLRNDPGRLLGVDLYLAFSTDGGLHFGASRRISRTTWDATYAAFSRGKFLGDYQGLVAGKKLFHPLFVTTYRRSARDPERLQPDVFTASIR